MQLTLKLVKIIMNHKWDRTFYVMFHQFSISMIMQNFNVKARVLILVKRNAVAMNVKADHAFCLQLNHACNQVITWAIR